MSEQLRESLSALKDGESEELELRRLLAHENVEAVNQSWQGFNRIGDLMSGQQASHLQWDISARVATAIANEACISESKNANAQQVSGEKQEQRPTWMKPFAGFAVAASVTMAVVMGAQILDPSQTGITSQPSSPAVASRVYPAAISNVSVGTANVGAQLDSRSALPDSSLSQQVLMGDLAAEERLERYLLQHTEQSALNNGQGMINFARVSSFEVE